MTNAQYIAKLKTDILGSWSEARGMIPEDVQEYFDGHRPRFEAQLDMFRAHLLEEPIRKVYDMGTGVPFASYYFHLTRDAEIVCGMPTDKPTEGRVRLENINLCDIPPLIPADLVICTECLEHLPCPLPPVAAWLKMLVRPEGFLLLSFPFGPIRAAWEKDFGSHEKIRGEHLREFDMPLARAFLRLIGWPVIAEKLTYTRAYGGDIFNVLLREGPAPAEMPEPKVLITGSEGLLGGWITEEFTRQGTEFVRYDLKTGQDIFNAAKLREAMAGCTAVIHLVAYPDRRAAPNKAAFLHLNHEGAIAAFQAARDAGVPRFVYCSSGNVYCFGDGIQDDRPLPIDVDDTPSPELIHPYPKSKLLTRQWLEENHGDMQVIVLRPNCLAPTPEPWLSIWKGATITRERLVRYFHAAATARIEEQFIVLDVIEPNPNYLGSLRAKELLDR